MLNANEDYSLWELEKFCKLIESETIYFLCDDNQTYRKFIKSKDGMPYTIKEYIQYFLNNGQIQEYEELKKENKILKKRIKKLTQYKKFSEKFTDLEPKKRLKVTAEELEKIKELKEQGISVSKIAKTYGVTPKTIYNYLNKDNLKN